RIDGEAQKVGLGVSHSTVAKYMRRHGRPPSQTSRTCLTTRASQIMAGGFIVAPTVMLRLLFGLTNRRPRSAAHVHVAVTSRRPDHGCGHARRAVRTAPRPHWRTRTSSA